MLTKRIIYKGISFINNNIVFNRHTSGGKLRKEVIAELKEKGCAEFLLRERPLGLTSRVILGYLPNSRLANHAVRISAIGTKSTKDIAWMNTYSNGIEKHTISIFKSKRKLNDDVRIIKKRLVTKNGKKAEYDIKDNYYNANKSFLMTVLDYLKFKIGCYKAN